MKNILTLLFILLFVSCSSINKYNSDLKIIKYEKFGAIKYDWYSSLKIKDNYCLYFQNELMEYKTNYIYGDFELINYNDYRKIKD